MTRRQYLTALDAARADFDRWTYDRERRRYTLVVDDLQIHIDSTGSGAQWMVEHANYGVVQTWTPAEVASYARREALDFTRAWVNVNIAESMIPA
jgi:hypothetical protein